jgi:hypothetical protein
MSIEAMKEALEALENHMEQTRPINMTQNAIHALRQAIEQAEKQEPRKEWVGLTDDDWGQLWQDFEDACDELEVAYQEEARKKHGEGHYYISSEDQWEYDKRTIRDLVEAKLKEKNT